jgi:hypothetical protein
MDSNLRELKPGDRISFDVATSKKTPYGFGVVTQVTAVGPLIKPDAPLAAGMKMSNIRKVGEVRQ